MIQQTLTGTTERAILELERYGWRFRVSRNSGKNRMVVFRGQVDDETKQVLRQVKVSEACEYLTERAQGYIRGCKNILMTGGADR